MFIIMGGIVVLGLLFGVIGWWNYSWSRFPNTPRIVATFQGSRWLIDALMWASVILVGVFIYVQAGTSTLLWSAVGGFVLGRWLGRSLVSASYGVGQ